MSKDKKTGRPISNNVDYFPHKCKDDKELRFIQHKYKSEGYEVFYRLQQCLGDAEFHRIDLGNPTIISKYVSKAKIGESYTKKSYTLGLPITYVT